MLKNAANDRRDGETNDSLDSPAKNDFTFEPLSVFEKYMLTDGCPQFRMEPVIHLYFRGKLNREVARQALQTVLARHPLVRSRVARRFGRLCWVPAKTLPEVSYVDYDATPDVLNESDFPILRPINLFAEPGFRVYHIESKRGNWFRLVLQFHHAVSDGIGMFQALEEWLILYARGVDDLVADVEIPEICPEALKDRRRIGWSLRSYLRNFSNTRRSTRQYLFFPRSLVPTRLFAKIEPEKDSPFVTSIKLSREETSAYLARAKALGATVNDALLADCFRAMDKWLSDVRGDEKDGRMRVMAPINMRTPESRRAPLSNVVSTVFLDRPRRMTSLSDDSLIQSVASEMRWVKQKDQRFVFLLLMRVLRYIPGALQLALRSPICRATSVLSNLGRVLNDAPTRRDEKGRIVVGGATLEQVEAEAPIRRRTSFSVVGLTYAGELNLCVHYDSRLIGLDQAREFARIFRELLL